MKKLITFLLLIALTGSLAAKLSVTSFRKLENDADARSKEPLKDPNGDACAIIKVITSQTGFLFECDQSGIVKVEQKQSAIWIYLPSGSKRLTIEHPQLGILRDYLFPVPIKKATAYELVLSSGKVITTVVEEINSQWLSINPIPADAMVYVNDRFVKNGAYLARLKPGSYKYRVESPLYYTEAGNVVIADTAKVLNVELKPAFGYLSVTSEPEQEAKILVDGKLQSKTTPGTTEPLSSGEHTVQVFKEMYQPSFQKIMVEDGKTKPCNFKLIPTFAEISIKAPNDAAVYINNEQKGAGSWQGRLNSGVYSVEARKPNHHPAKKDIEIAAGDKQTIDLQPIPIYGSLDIISTPIGATITINGKVFGTTPNTINDLIIGEYEVELSLNQYITTIEKAFVTENQTVTLNTSLTKGQVLAINSTPSGATINIDGREYGTTPKSLTLQKGDHSVLLSLNGYLPGKKTVTLDKKNTELNETLEKVPEAVTKDSTQNVVKPVQFINQDVTIPTVTQSDKRKYIPKYYSLRRGKTFWLITTLLSGAATAYSYLQSEDYYKQYQSAMSDAGNLHSQVEMYDQIFQISAGVAAFSTLKFFIKAIRQGNAKKKPVPISFYPIQLRNGAGVGLAYNF
ncbi:MAG: PEGA domain-containing protein [Mariniphaga sp.]